MADGWRLCSAADSRRAYSRLWRRILPLLNCPDHQVVRSYTFGGLMMSFSNNPLRKVAVSFFAVLMLSAAALAKGNAAFPNVNIKNFGQMDERFYRGAEPKDVEDFQALKALGINTVIDLQAKPEASERGNVESLGMRYVNIPMVDKEYPRPEWVAAFLKTVDDPRTGKFFVHRSEERRVGKEC